MQATAAHFSVIQLHFCTTPCLRAAKNTPPPADAAGNTHTHVKRLHFRSLPSHTLAGGRRVGKNTLHIRSHRHITTLSDERHGTSPPTAANNQPASHPPQLGLEQTKSPCRVCVVHVRQTTHTRTHTLTHTGGAGTYVLHTICARLGHRSG